jgi:hypothetical protein
MSSSRHFTQLVLIAACGLVVANLAFLPGLTARPHAQAQQPPPQTTSAADFVGDDTCIACHEPEGQRLSVTRHGKAANPRTPSAKPNQSCETCHGPGKEHAESGDKSKIRVSGC